MKSAKRANLDPAHDFQHSTLIGSMFESRINLFSDLGNIFLGARLDEGRGALAEIESIIMNTA